MKLFDIITKVGGSVIKTVVPGGGLIVDLVNEFLPDDSKLSSDATGTDIEKAVNALPPEQRAQLMGREFDVQETQIKEDGATLRAALDADAKNPQSTRPYIAKQAFHILAVVALIVVGMWAYGIFEQDVELVKSVTAGWPFVASVIGPFIVLLLAYFGVLAKEQRQKLSAAAGAPVSGVAGLISTFLKR